MAPHSGLRFEGGIDVRLRVVTAGVAGAVGVDGVKVSHVLLHLEVNLPRRHEGTAKPLQKGYFVSQMSHFYIALEEKIVSSVSEEVNITIVFQTASAVIL